jgi:HK97 family phage major capsid protein
MEFTDEQLIEFGEKAVKAALDKHQVGLPEQIRAEIEKNIPELVKAEIARTVTPELLRKNQTPDERVERMNLLRGFILGVARNNRGAIEELAKNHESLYFGVNKAVFSDLTDGQGGYLMPEAWADEIMSLTSNFGFFRRLARVYPMTTKTENIPVGGDVVISYPDENTSATVTDAANYFANTKLTVALMAAGIILKQDFLEDINADLLDFFTQEVAKAFAKEEDLQGFAGIGAPFTGLINTGGVNVSYFGGALNSGKTSFNQISWRDLVDVSETINSDKQLDAAYFMSQAVFKEVRKEADANGRPIQEMFSILHILAQAGVIPKTGIEGLGATQTYVGPGNYPLHVVPNGVLPTNGADRPAVIFGSLRRYAMMGVRKQITQRFYDQQYSGVDLASRNLIAFASMQRKGFAFPMPSAFAVLKTAQS